METAVVQASIEMDLVQMTLRSIVELKSFPNLRAVSVGSIFGSQDAVWGRVYRQEKVLRDFDWDWEVDTYDVLEHSNSTFQSLLKRSPLTHFCQRGSRGPLSLPKFITWFGGSFAERPYNIPLFTIHFDTSTEYIPISLRDRTNWVLETHARRKPMPDLFSFVARGMDQSLEERTEVEVHSSKRHVHLNLEVFCSSDHVTGGPSDPEPMLSLNPDGERDFCSGMQSRMRDVWREDSKNHVLSWKASVDSPPCVACGWAFQHPEDPVKANHGAVDAIIRDIHDGRAW